MKYLMTSCSVLLSICLGYLLWWLPRYWFQQEPIDYGILYVAALLFCGFLIGFLCGKRPVSGWSGLILGQWFFLYLGPPAPLMVIGMILIIFYSLAGLIGVFLGNKIHLKIFHPT